MDMPERMEDSTPMAYRYPDPVYVEQALSGAPAGEEAVIEQQVLEALADMSRRIEFLSRELDCLGYFDDAEGPRAA